MQRFFSEVHVETPRSYAFRWHEAENAFERLNPPWEKTELLEKDGSIEEGTVKLRTKVGPFWIGIKAKHSQFVRDEQFFDEMIGGPFRRWEHLHKFEIVDEDRSKVIDQIDYKIKGGFLGRLVAGGMVKSRMEQLFAYRRIVTKTEIEDHFQYADKSPKTIAVTGATGLIGKSICEFLRGGGHKIILLRRSKDDTPSNQPCWNPETGVVHFGEGIDAVDSFLHLAGYPIADKRWNENVKKLIRESRVPVTQKLTQHLADEKKVRESFVCASAIGFYGDRQDEELEESADPGSGFLAESCVAWEDACASIRDAGVRVVNMRLSVILSSKGGALNALLTPFKLGAGGKVGSGQQYWSWISFLDTLRAIHFSIMNDAVEGPVNFASPDPVRQKDFAKCLGRVLFRPSFMPLPGWAARMVLGEMVDHLLLASANVVPKKLIDAGFKFVHNRLEDALRFELGRIRTNSESLSTEK